MTKVICTFEKCLFIKNGICQKEEIELDEQVRYIDCGCPNAEWEEEEDDDMYTISSDSGTVGVRNGDNQF